MALLILGLILWIAAHMLKRLAPDARAALTARMGSASKGVIAAAIGIGLVLMIFGYRAAPFVGVYTPPGWTIHLNNLLMLAAVALIGAGHSKGRARSLMRHPMLTGVIVWSVAHLLVNGDLASILLFGVLGLWALAEIALINSREPEWVRPAPGPASGDLRLALITVAVFAVIAGIHAWLGYWPFPR